MTDTIPRHVAIIPDGNRRWAKARGKDAYYGHKRGTALFEEIAWHGFDAGVECLSLWGMSVDNFKKRSKTEIAGLMRILRREFQRLLQSEDLHARRVKVNVFGRWEKIFPAVVKKPIREITELTGNYQSCLLNFLLAYNGTDEMIEAVQAILEQTRRGGGPARVTGRAIKDNLYTKDLPPVDLLIRTGGEPHLSNGFMMWDVADAELYFTDKLWPDFDKNEFDEALKSYSLRRRRRGT
jgi:undecaprenyl diphosphate synthase